MYTYTDLVLARFLRFSIDIYFYPIIDFFMLYNDGNKIFYGYKEFYSHSITSIPDVELIKEAFNVVFN